MRVVCKALLLMAAAVALMSCSFVSDMTDTYKQAETVAEELEKAVGVKPFVGWNINNATLTNVNVTFPLDGVAKMNVGELHAKVSEAVKQHFAKMPGQLVVSTTAAK